MSDNLDFHYKRDERLAMHSAPEPRGPQRGPFRGNRRSFFLLLNLVLIVVLFAVYARSQGSAHHTAELSGWRVTLRGVPAGADVLAVLEANADATAQARAGGEERLFVIFRAGGAELRLSEVLPAQGGSIALNARLVEAGKPRDLSAEVSIGGKKATLRRSLDRE